MGAEKISLWVTLVAQESEMRWVLRDRMMRIRDGAGLKWLRLSLLPMQEVWVPLLVGELRFHMPHRAAKNEIERERKRWGRSE